MTKEDKKKIVAYLCGPRNYKEGVQLYDKYGYNRMYKRRFLLEDTEFSRQLLFEELRKLAGLSETEFNRLPRLARQQSLENKQANNRQVVGKLNNGNTPVPEAVEKVIRFRDQFPFLNRPDCPNELKILVADMFAAHDRYKEAHARLVELDDKDAAAAAKEAETIIENHLANREMWEELEHYKENGVLLGKAAVCKNTTDVKDNIAELSDLDLTKKLNSARANQSKHRKGLEKAVAEGRDTAKYEAALAIWTEAREALEAELERRKKK